MSSSTNQPDSNPRPPGLALVRRSPSSATKPGFDVPSAGPGVSEVRYFLPAMLQELKAERAAATFAMEILDQNEIGKLFKAKPSRRGKSAK